MSDSSSHPYGLPVGSVLDGKYEILALLGVGGMGEVYKARHAHLNTLRCIKVMRQSLAADDGFRARFLREARLATRVQHPNVAIAHDFSLSDGGISYLVTEYIDGITLRDWSRHNGRFPVSLAADIAIQVLSGLHEIHKQGLIHRDISSENIMITFDDDRWIAKIIDLGIAKALETPLSERTQVGLFVGNPRYSSPEQLGDIPEGEEIDGRSDVYSLGVVMYEMVVGAAPFSSTTPQGYVVKHLKERPRPLAQVAPEIDWPHGFEDVLFKALEKQRANRYGSAREFARALFPFTQVAARTVETDLRDFLGSATPTPPPLRTQPDLLKRPTLRDTTERQMLPDVIVPAGRGEDEVVTTAMRAADASAPVAPAQPEEQPESESRSPEDEKRAEAEAAFAAALEENSAAAWRLFLERHADSEGATDALAILRALDDAAFDRFVEDHDPGALQRFVAEFPESVHLAEAKQLAREWRQELEMTAAWEVAVREDATALYRAFAQSYPGSSLAAEAGRRVEEKEHLAKVAAALAKKDRIALALITRMKDFPAAARAAREAIAALDREEQASRAGVEWEEAWRDGSVAAFERFLERHPESRYDAEAREAMAEAVAFENAVRANDLALIKAFLHDYPEGRHSAEMRIRASELKRESTGTGTGTRRPSAKPDAVLEQLRASVRPEKKQ